MAVYTKRVQAVLTEAQHAALQALSERTGKPISVLIRDAVERVYLKPTEMAKRREALVDLLSLNAPVSDWDQMEMDIINGARP